MTPPSIQGSVHDERTAEGVPTTQSEQPVRRSRRDLLIVLAALAFPILLETLDYTIVTTAQVDIASYFNRLDLQTYVGSVYLLTSTVFLPAFASLGDIFGRHSALQLGLLIFLAGNAISTGAQNMAMMLGGRGVAGVGAAGMLTIVRVIVADVHSIDDTNWQTTALWFLYGVGYGIGPYLGGVLVSVSFRWVFAVNLPCALFSMIICFFVLRGRTKAGQSARYLPTTASAVQGETFIDKLLRVDWIGTALFVAGGILVLLALEWGSQNVWDRPRVIICFVVGGVLFFACFGWQYYLERVQSTSTTVKHRVLCVCPMIPLIIMRSYDIVAVLAISFVDGMVTLVMFYFIAVFMAIVRGLEPSTAGVQLTYFIPGLGGGSLASILLIKRIRQPRYPVIISAVLYCLSLGLISEAVRDSNQSQVNGYLAMSGVAAGLSLSSLPIHARFSQPDDKVAIVSALILFFRTFGGTVGLAQCGAVMNSKVRSYIFSLASQGVISTSEAAELAALGSATTGFMDSLPENVQTVFRDAFRNGTRWCFISLIPYCGIAFILSLFLKNIPDFARQFERGRENVEPEKIEDNPKAVADRRDQPTPHSDPATA